MKVFQDSLAKLFVNPEVNKEVCKVVDVDDKTHVARDGGFCGGCVDEGRVGCNNQEK